MNTTLRDILWWLPMWTFMGVAGYYLGRKADEWAQKRTLLCLGIMVAIFVLWPILGGVIFTYG